MQLRQLGFLCSLSAIAFTNRDRPSLSAKSVADFPNLRRRCDHYVCILSFHYLFRILTSTSGCFKRSKATPSIPAIAACLTIITTMIEGDGISEDELGSIYIKAVFPLESTLDKDA